MKLISLFLVCLFLVGCVGVATKNAPSGVPIPSDWRWTLRKKAQQNTAQMMQSRLVDPNALYVRKDIQHFPTGDRVGFTFFRFWPDGHFLYRNIAIKDREPTAIDGDQWRGLCQIGYYVISGDRIKIEMYGWDNVMIRAEGLITFECITFDIRSMGRKIEMKFVRKPFPPGAMQRIPDW